MLDFVQLLELFSYRALDARFMGLDGGAVLGQRAPVGVRVQGAVVRGMNRESGDALLYLPGDSATLGMLGALPDVGGWSGTRMELSTTWVAQQRPESPDDLAPPPPGYSLLNASVRGQLALRQGRVMSLSIFGGNLMNVRYRDATSLLRYTADEAGREFRLRLGLDF